MEYTGIENQKNISINKIFSVHYFEYACNFSFAGESHDFWEFICVDKGIVHILAGKEELTLQENDIFFHEPNEFHAVHTDGKTAPNLVVVSFSCHDEIMNFFKHKKLHLTQQERNILGNLIREAKYCFDCRLDDPYLKTIPLKDSAILGSQQSVFLYLEQFLIHLLRKKSNQPTVMIKATKQTTDAQLFNEIIKYLQNNLHASITVNSVCEKFSISRSKLQRLFKSHCNLGIIEYFSFLKIEMAKELIRTRGMNFSQISVELGYSSIHYFSRQFKKIAGMTPSEYATSIKLVFEID